MVSTMGSPAYVVVENSFPCEQDGDVPVSLPTLISSRSSRTDSTASGLIVKNTFINFDTKDMCTPRRNDRRLQSVPCAWRPFEIDEESDASDDEDEDVPVHQRSGSVNYVGEGEETKCASRRISADSEAPMGTSRESASTVLTESKRLRDALCLEKRALACLPAPCLAQCQISGSSSALVRSGIVPRHALAPLVLPRPHLNGASCARDEFGDESDDESGPPVVKKKSVTFANATETIIVPTLQVAKLSATAAAAIPPPPAPRLPRSPRTAKATAFAPQQRLPVTPSKTSANSALVAQTKYGTLVDHVQHQLKAHRDCVVDVTVVEGPRGWNVTAYVKPDQLKLQVDNLMERAQQAILDVAEKSGTVYVLGYKTRPFAIMPLGFGCALAVMHDPDLACWGSFSKGFCRSPGSCKLQHPKDQGGVNVMFKPARVR